MKSNIVTLIDMAISESKNYIIENGGNVAGYFISYAESADQGWLWYLSDEEIVMFEKGSVNYRNSLIQGIKIFLEENYNFNIAEQQKADILQAMKELIKEGVPLVVGSEYNGSNPSVFDEFSETNGFNRVLVVDVYHENEKELNELWNEVNS